MLTLQKQLLVYLFIYLFIYLFFYLFIQYIDTRLGSYKVFYGSQSHVLIAWRSTFLELYVGVIWSLLDLISNF